MDWIDMRSDTVTKPTLEMRAAMASAEVGDDVYQDDPTTNRLEARAAELLGFEAALFITSGTMGNQLALMCNTRRGDEVIAGAECHIVMHEVGAAAVLSGANIRQIPYENGLPVPARIEAAIRPDDIHEPRTALICMENALANGRVVPLDTMREIYTLAHAHGIPVHLDGARIFNAAVALGVDVKELTQHTDTLTCCLSKGLCAPVGAVFAGSREMVERAGGTARCWAAVCGKTVSLQQQACLQLKKCRSACTLIMKTPAIWHRCCRASLASRSTLTV